METPPMQPCPGCGLPRVAAQIGVVPCPVCADTAPPVPAASPPPSPPPDPFAHLPADAASLQAAMAGGHPAATARSVTTAAAAAIRRGMRHLPAFALGLLAGSLGLWLIQQQLDQIPPEPQEECVPPPLRPVSPSGPELAQAPPPRPSDGDAAPDRPPENRPSPQPQPPQPQQVGVEPPEARQDATPPLGWSQPPRTVWLHQPDASYTLPEELCRGGQVVLRGRIRELRIPGLSAQAHIDASGLEARSVFVGGLDGGSELKVFAPQGVVSVRGHVRDRARLTIHAPGGLVRFGGHRPANAPQPLIAAAARVEVTARQVRVEGTVRDPGTRLSVHLEEGGQLWVEAVRGGAQVDYRCDGRPADARAGLVEPTARFEPHAAD